MKDKVVAWVTGTVYWLVSLVVNAALAAVPVMFAFGFAHSFAELGFVPALGLVASFALCVAVGALVNPPWKVNVGS